MIDHKEQASALSVNDTFNFKCGPESPCFTRCCRNVTIFLTPYDVIRLKKRLGISSTEFLDKYTVTLKIGDKVVPLLVLKMGEDQEQRCQLVTEKGCSVYEDRPWSCRMYPLDQRSSASFTFIAESTTCKGLEDAHTYKVSDYLVDQGILIYKEMEELFEEITSHPNVHQLDIDNETIAQMLHMALYDIDRFRDFVFKSDLLKRFDIDETTLHTIENNDVELMKFGFKWIKFGLFGDPFYKLREDVLPPNQETKPA